MTAKATCTDLQDCCSTEHRDVLQAVPTNTHNCEANGHSAGVLMRMSRPLLHAVVGRYAESAWGVEIDRVKADKGNAFMRYAAADMKRRNADWADFQVPSIRCAPIEEVTALFAHI